MKNYNQPRRDQRQQVNEAAYQEGLMTVAEGGSLYHLDMNMIADGITLSRRGAASDGGEQVRLVTSFNTSPASIHRILEIAQSHAGK